MNLISKVRSSVILLVVFMIPSIIACNKTYQIKPEDFEGIELKGRNGTFKMTMTVKAESDCPTIMTIKTGFQDYQFIFLQTLDTMVSSDWYGEPMKLKVQTDDCMSKAPSIKVTFYD